MTSTTRIGILMGAALVSACAPAAPDTILLNGKIFTANAAQPWAEALAIRGERIIAVGANTAIAAQAGTSTRRLDLGGRTVVPGFNDAHITVTRPAVDTARLLGADAIARGVTSIQIFSAGPVPAAVQAFRNADLPQRVRVIRMPEPDESGANRDSRPYFPPQPRPRLEARGMGFVLGSSDGARLQQAIGWAYGTEDPLAIDCEDTEMLEAYVAALESHGAAEVWKAKRPRIERPASLPANAAARLTKLGAVIVQAPFDSRASGDAGGPLAQGRPRAGVPLKSILIARVSLALGSGGSLRGLDIIRSAVDPSQGGEALTREEAVTAYTRGSAFSESAERDKGRLAVGMLADLAVLSADMFTVPLEQMAAIRSVMTIIGGRVVHDTGVLR
ncbi:MAG: amidohydrolase family protein [Acidobacteriota bacterium]|nr:amidohydrolase family protein [Acidobacteriota bacterium]